MHALFSTLFCHYHVSWQGSWEKRIIERINNQRGQAMRKRPRSDDDTSTPAKRGRPKESTLLCRYPALQLDDGHSDEVSLSRNQAKLNEEASKTNPSKAAILPLQRMTYVKRREFILSGLDAIGIILEEHPLLRHPFAVSSYAYITGLVYDIYPTCVHGITMTIILV